MSITSITTSEALTSITSIKKNLRNLNYLTTDYITTSEISDYYLLISFICRKFAAEYK